MSNSAIKERKRKFRNSSNDLNIKIIEGTNNTISYKKHYINNGQKLKIDLLVQVLKRNILTIVLI